MTLRSITSQQSSGPGQLSEQDPAESQVSDLLLRAQLRAALPAGPKRIEHGGHFVMRYVLANPG